CVSALELQGRTIWSADAHREDRKRFVVRSDELLTAFIELCARSYFVFMHGFDHSHGPVGALQDAPAGTTCPALPRLRCSTCRAVGSPLVAGFGASSQRGFAATNCITVEGFLQRSQRHSKKIAPSWRVSGRLSAYAHEPAQQQTRRATTKRETK